MQDVPMKPFVIGIIFASVFWGLIFFVLIRDTKRPNYEGLEPRYEIYAASVTEHERLFDTRTNRTVLWTPGNPKVKVVGISEISDGRWLVELEKIDYWK